MSARLLHCIAVWMLLSSQHASGHDQDCCPKKKQNEDIYDFVTSSNEETAEKGCKDVCVYQKRADGKRYCFKEGGLPTECLYADNLSSSAGTMTPDAAMTTSTTSTTTLDPVCGTFTTATHDGIEYTFGSGSITWLKAKSCCTNKGAKLAKARTLQQLDIIYSSLPIGSTPWMDGTSDSTDQETWVDSDGGKVPVSLWQSGEPSMGGCMYLTDNRLWSYFCLGSSTYLCEY